ncbi:EpsG family protein [Acinetobacter guillouiae]|uniref:EpsG family protein n=1 Tax=Acinetobacter guillouiae TaxID=106649 RepID=UPI0026E419C6|nr:EpsG family protein [Acinetobacter guillouiae]MDO6645483.1 EpsG family protein [Acinetobacter guillouiae]
MKGWQIFVLLIPAILVFFLRGNVGTDTYYYLGLLDDYMHYGESLVKYEPGFEFLGKTLTYIGLSPRIALATIGLITTFILCKTYAASKRQMLVFTLLVFPLFFYDFTMNGIRYGLSFSLATVAVDLIYRKKYRSATIWGLIAFSVQYSSLLVILPFVGALVRKRYVIVVVVLMVGAFLASPDLFSLITDRVAGKRDAYSEVFAPSIFSGLAPLITVSLIYGVFLHYCSKSYSKLIHVIFLFEVLSYLMSKFTYAGLRFQGVFMYAMILYIKNNIDFMEYIFIRKVIYFLIILSFFGILIFIKNILIIDPNDMSPFLPYTFFWEEKGI